MFALRTVAILDEGAFSVLLHDGKPFAVTCEHTFAGQQTVITSGVYRCRRDFYHGGGHETYEIEVPGHSRVLFHRGNTEADSRGCILVAESFAEFAGRVGVAASRAGFDEFMRRAAGVEEFDLSVTGR